MKTPAYAIPVALGLALLAGLASGCEKSGGDEGSAIERQILQQIGALQDDVDELKDAVADLKTQPARPAPRPSTARPTTARVPVQTAGFPALGPKDAPVTVVEFTDYQCPFCRRHFAQTLPQIKTHYVDTGKVRYVVVDNPLPGHRYAVPAAEAAHCAGDQGKFWEMHDYLFNNQHLIKPEALPGFAKTLGMDEKTFSACMAANQHQPQIQSGERMAAAAGVTGTPSFVVGKTTPDGTVSGDLIVGAKAYALFKGRLDKLLAD